MGSALSYYSAALRRAAAGKPSPLRMTAAGSPRGTAVLAVPLPGRATADRDVDPRQWCAGLRPGDRGVLRRCAGPTLDVGCGPGRLTAALRGAGRAALGIDICPVAVRLARGRGAPAVRADVFAPVPAEGTWRSVMLIDGNIGIGGDPARLLRRCRRLLAPGGQVLVELDPPGAPSWRGPVVIGHDGGTSDPFGWAALSIDDATAVAAEARLRVKEVWTGSRRWFARLCGA